MSKIILAAFAASLALATPALAEMGNDRDFNAVQQSQQIGQSREFLSSTDVNTNDHPAQQSDFYSVVHSQTR